MTHLVLVLNLLPSTRSLQSKIKTGTSVLLRVLLLLFVVGSDAAARVTFPVPRAQHGTLDISIAPGLLAALVTHYDSADNSQHTTARGFEQVYSGSSSTGDVQKINHTCC